MVCTKDGERMKLVDLPSELLYRTFDNVRERLRIHVKTMHENVVNTIDSFGSDMTGVLSEMQRVP